MATGKPVQLGLMCRRGASRWPPRPLEWVLEGWHDEVAAVPGDRSSTDPDDLHEQSVLVPSLWGGSGPRHPRDAHSAHRGRVQATTPDLRPIPQVHPKAIAPRPTQAHDVADTKRRNVSTVTPRLLAPALSSRFATCRAVGGMRPTSDDHPPLRPGTKARGLSRLPGAERFPEQQAVQPTLMEASTSPFCTRTRVRGRRPATPVASWKISPPARP